MYFKAWQTFSGCHTDIFVLKSNFMIQHHYKSSLFWLVCFLFVISWHSNIKNPWNVAAFTLTRAVDNITCGSLVWTGHLALTPVPTCCRHGHSTGTLTGWVACGFWIDHWLDLRLVACEQGKGLSKKVKMPSAVTIVWINLYYSDSLLRLFLECGY